MYAGVKYLSDNTVAVVPIHYVKHFKLPIDVGKTYQVFWSQDSEEPNGTHKNVDKIFKNLSSRKDKQGSLPPNGYYNAKILCIADSLKEVNDSLDALGLPLQRRSVEVLSKSSAKKLISSAASSVLRTALYDNSLVFSDDDDTDADETVEPVKMYKEKLKGLESENTKLAKENEALKLEVDAVRELLKKQEDETKNVSQKLEATKEKYKNLKREFKTARELNYELQKKLIGSLNFVGTPIMNDANSSINNSIHQYSSAIEQPSSPSLLSAVSSPSMTNSTPTYNPPTPTFKRPLNDNVENCSSSKMSKISQAHTAQDETPDLLFSSNEADLSTIAEAPLLSEAMIHSSSMGCRHGKDGDKVFVKNLAFNLFGEDVLVNSSATGRKPPTGGKPARPALPKAGILYIQNLLQQRVVSEMIRRSDLSEDEKKSVVAQRASFVVVVQAIGDKIATLRRIRK